VIRRLITIHWVAAQRLSKPRTHNSKREPSRELCPPPRHVLTSSLTNPPLDAFFESPSPPAASGTPRASRGAIEPFEPPMSPRRAILTSPAPVRRDVS
jgi:hypothetical protein